MGNMAFVQRIKSSTCRVPSSSTAVETNEAVRLGYAQADEKHTMESRSEANVEAGVSAMAAAQAVWGKPGFRLVVLG